jgi:hypothetical protein
MITPTSGDGINRVVDLMLERVGGRHAAAVAAMAIAATAN